MSKMKKITASGLGFLLFASPALALADSLTPVQAQIRQLTVIAATLEAQEAALSSGQSIACAALVSKQNVHVNEPFALAWGSVGAMSPGDDPTKSMWAPNGVSTISLQQPGTWTYKFIFYAKSGGSTTCTAKVVVSSQ